MKYYIGIDLGGTSIKGGLVDEEFHLIEKHSVPTRVELGEQTIAQDIYDLVEIILQKTGKTLDEIAWIGLGCPGTVNKDTGIIERAANLNFFHTPLKKYLSQLFQKEIFIENDANVAALGEFYAGAAKEYSSAITITLGTGVGSGIIIDGKILRGFNSAGGELGHMAIEIDGRLCTCGRRGCFEMYASATGLTQTTREYMQRYKDSQMWDLVNGDIEKVGGRIAFQAMKLGDAGGREAVHLYLKHLSAGVVNAINLFQPDILCVGGGVSKEGDYLLEPLRELVKAEVFSKYSGKQTRIVVAALGNDAGMIGAATLGLK